jgi:hypothetical protein
MSYCRWSSDGFYCDLYCYQSQDGYVTDVAARRRAQRAPLIIWNEDIDKLIASHKAQDEFLADEKSNPPLPIGLEHDGKSFLDGDLESFLGTLKMLKAAGYQFPDGVITDVEEELAEELAQEVLEGPPSPGMRK